MHRLDGKVALVTGAGRAGGLGEAICLRLATAGARIVVTDLGRSKEQTGAGHIGTTREMEAVAAHVTEAGSEAISVALDVRDEDQVQAAVQRTVEAFGRLDILVNNAGIGYLISPLVETSAEQWRTVIDVNLTGAFLCTKHAAAQMMRQGQGGRVVNVASQAAKSGHRHMSAYTASKHGMVGLTRSAAMELGPHGIAVNCVMPGGVDTALSNQDARDKVELDAVFADLPIPRAGFAEEIAAASLYLQSREAAYCTGTELLVDGGMSAGKYYDFLPGAPGSR